MTPLAKLIIELAGDLLGIIAGGESEEEILERISARVGEAASAIAGLPSIQAGRWKELQDAIEAARSDR